MLASLFLAIHSQSLTVIKNNAPELGDMEAKFRRYGSHLTDNLPHVLLLRIARKLGLPEGLVGIRRRIVRGLEPRVFLEGEVRNA